MKWSKKALAVLLTLVLLIVLFTNLSSAILKVTSIQVSKAADDESCSICGPCGQSGNGEESESLPLMHLSYDTFLKWQESDKKLPQYNIYGNQNIQSLPAGNVNLLDHIKYNPTDRKQGCCGNCWVWAGTGVMEVALDEQTKIKDRLSIQYFNSNYNGGIGSVSGGKPCCWACCGGNIEEFSDFYSKKGMAIPWSNTKASWQDENRKCEDLSTSVSASSISTVPHYSINSIQPVNIATWDVGKSAAIDNIKSILNQNKAVYFRFYLPTKTDWQTFRNFWNENTEDSIINNLDSACGKTWDDKEGGGHAVVCVGYNDTDPDPKNHYWLMLNSWGTASGLRPNGLFRISMDMNYDCSYPRVDFPSPLHAFSWQTLDISFPSTSIKVFRPAKGEVWTIGETGIIGWEESNTLTGEIQISYKTSSTGTWNPIATLPISPNTSRVYNWVVEGPASTDCYVKVENVDTWSGVSFAHGESECFTIASSSQPDFLISASPPSQPVTQGGSTSYTVNLTSQNGFNDSVTLSIASTLPSGVNATFSQNPITPTASSSLNISTSASTPADTYIITINASGGGKEHSVSVTLIVGSSPDFSLYVTPTSQTVVPGGSVDYSVIVTALNGFNDAVSLSVSGLPTDTTYKFEPQSFIPSTSGSTSTLTITTSAVENVTVTLYMHENTVDGPLLSGVAVGVYDGGGNLLGGTTNSSGYVTFTGVPGTWYFSAGKSGYDTKDWNQSITATCTVNQYLVKSAIPVGTIDVFAWLNGSAWAGSLNYTLTGPSSSGGTTVPRVYSNMPVGTYSVTYNSGGPPNSTLSSITPSSTQTLTTGNTVTFNLNFTSNLTKPSPPQNLDAAVVFDSSDRKAGVRISWSPPADNGGSPVTTYKMYRKLKGGSYTYIGPRDPAYTSFRDWGVQLGKTYYYKVTAVNSIGESDPSNEKDIIVGVLVQTTTTVNVRSGAGTSYSIITTLPTGVYGLALGGPTYANGYYWWYCFWGSPYSVYGWSVENYLWFYSGPLSFEPEPVLESFVGTGKGNRFFHNEQTKTFGEINQVNLSFDDHLQEENQFINEEEVFLLSPTTVSVPSSTPVGAYTITITATGGGKTHTAQVTLNVTSSPDFSISATPSSRSVIQGGSTTYSVALTAQNGFNSSVSLSAAGLPAGATASFNPSSLVPTGPSTLTISTATSTPTGTYTITITATGGGKTHTAQVTLNVTSSPDFSISASPPSQSVTQGGSTTYSVSLSAVNGFNSSVSLSASGLPSGANPSFNPSPLTPPGSSTLTISTSSSTPVGTYTITITATGGGKTHTAQVTLNVTSSTTVPTVLTLDATNIGESFAIINGQVTNDGGSNITYRAFSWGEKSDESDRQFVYSVTANGNYFSYNLSSLEPGTTYYFRAWAENSAGWGEGPLKQFTIHPSTPPSAPQNLTATAGDSQVTLQWNAPSSDGGSSITGYRIYRGTSSGNETYYTAVGVRYDYINTGLTNGTRYYYKVSAVNSAGEGALSSEKSATPVAQTHTVTIADTASTIKWYNPVPDFSTPGTVNSANDILVYRMGDTIHGNLNFNPAQEWEIQLKKTEGTVVDVVNMASGGNSFTIGTSNISVDGEYYLTIYSSTNEFMDFNSNHFYIMYNLAWSANEIIPGQSTQTISGWIVRGSGQTIGVPVTVYVAYPNNITAGYYTIASNSSGQFSITFPTYSSEGDYNIYIRDGYDPTNNDNDAMIYDTLSSFSSPTIATNSASNITTTSATLNGNLTDMGGASSVTVYFQYGTSTSYGNTTTQQTKSSTGSFSANLSNLSPNTTYHYRAVAANSAGTSYGDDMTFTVSSSTSLTIHLKGNKFNLVSFPFTVNPSDIPNLVKAYSFDWTNYWQVWTPNGDQDFTTFKPGKGYWIKVSEDEDIPLTGTPASASNSDVIAPSGAQYGMSITQPANGSTVTTTSLQVSGTFDTAQPAGYEVILTVTANSQSHQYTYTLPNTQSTWGPITVPASDFDLTTGNSYPTTLEARLFDSGGIPVGPPSTDPVDSGTVNFTWKPSSSFPVTITPGKFNLLGVPFNSSIDISALNSANGNHILKIYSFDWTNYWQLWTPNGEQDFTTLEPGKGYWILFDSTAPTTFTFTVNP